MTVPTSLTTHVTLAVAGQEPSYVYFIAGDQCSVAFDSTHGRLVLEGTADEIVRWAQTLMVVVRNAERDLSGASK